MELICLLSSGQGTWAQVAGLMKYGDWEKVILIGDDFAKQFKHDKELDQGSKRTLSSFYKSLAAKGINVEELKKKLKVLAINTGKTILPYMIHNCHHFFPGSAVGKSFQILGLDVMIETIQADCLLVASDKGKYVKTTNCIT